MQLFSFQYSLHWWVTPTAYYLDLMWANYIGEAGQRYSLGWNIKLEIQANFITLLNNILFPHSLIQNSKLAEWQIFSCLYSFCLLHPQEQTHKIFGNKLVVLGLQFNCRLRGTSVCEDSGFWLTSGFVNICISIYMLIIWYKSISKIRGLSQATAKSWMNRFLVNSRFFRFVD